MKIQKKLTRQEDNLSQWMTSGQSKHTSPLRTQVEQKRQTDKERKWNQSLTIQDRMRMLEMLQSNKDDKKPVDWFNVINDLN